MSRDKTISWPEGFIHRMTDQLGTEAEAFKSALLESAPTSIRLHAVKGRTSFQLADQVKWCENGFYLETRPSFHLDPHWHGGAYYVQEASSMILDVVLQQLPLGNYPKIWLDLCAAPGGKTGILAKKLGPEDVLIANEIMSQRKSVLYENLIKGGYWQTFISSEKSSNFQDDFADIVLVDAPCSGEGMMRKEPEAARQWSEKLVQSCAVLQKDILRDAVRILKPGGFLIYSTCSYSPDENIRNAVFLQQTFPDLTNLTFSFPSDWEIQSIHENQIVGYQLFPHHVKGEGLFFTVFHKPIDTPSTYYPPRKPRRFYGPVETALDLFGEQADQFLQEEQQEGTDFIWKSSEAMANEVRQRLPRAELISKVGIQKGTDFIPSHFMAMSGLNATLFPFVNLSVNDALDFLERKNISGIPDQPNGWYVARYNDTNLGWLKNTRQAWKNHYPMHWRLRQRS